MVNQGTILGRVGDIKTKTTEQGVKVTHISMVTSKKFMRNGVREEKVTWHNVTMFNNLAEIAAKYVAVGDLLYVQGEMDSKKYIKDDVERQSFCVIAHEMKLMPKPKEHKAEAKSSPDDFSNGLDDLDIPF